MMQRIKSILLIATVTTFLFSCEDAPEGIQSALFDETGVTQPELDLAFTFRTDVNNLIDVSKDQNGVPNWSERIYFDTIITNQLEDDVENVQLSITGFDNTSFISDWNTDVLNFGFISQFGSGVPGLYWCFFCGEANEVYLGRTWVTTSPTGFGTSSVTINLRITFTYQGNFVSQDETHTFTIFP